MVLKGGTYWKFENTENGAWTTAFLIQDRPVCESKAFFVVLQLIKFNVNAVELEDVRATNSISPDIDKEP